MVTYEAMTLQGGRSVVQVLVVRVDIGVVIYEAMTPQCGRSVVQVLVVTVKIGVVTYEGRSVAQFMDIILIILPGFLSFHSVVLYLPFGLTNIFSVLL